MISSPSKWTNGGAFFVGWWNDDTYWEWLEACWRVFNGGSHCSCRTNCNTRHCHWKKIKTWLPPCLCRLQMSIMYKCDDWSWIRVRVDVVLHGHFQNYLPVNVVKFYIFPVLIMVNSTFYLVLRGANTMCVRGEWDLRSYMGLWASQIHCCNVRASIALTHRLLVQWSISW